MECGNQAAKFKLLNGYQRGFPLEREPFGRLAAETGLGVREVLETLADWMADGTVSRVGPVLKPGALGASTLAAMSVPAEEIERVAGIVSSFAEVNHNYEREGELNLWFVVTASSEENLREILDEIARQSGFQPLDLRLEEEFRIDLAFELPEGGGR